MSELESKTPLNPPLNPYAPASDGPLVDHVSDKVTRPAASGGNIVLRTLVGVSLSGSLFGMGTAAVMFFSDGFNGDISAIFWLLLLGATIGLVWAFMVALFVVPVSYFFCGLARANGKPWSGTGIQRFGAAVGFASGFFCVALPSRLDPWGLVAGCVPGTVGALFTWLFVKPLARRTESAMALQAAIESESESNPSPTTDNALAANPFAMDTQ